MESAKKKHSAAKKGKSTRMPTIGYWESPPEVPILNIRSMLTSLEKELELLSEASEVKKTEGTSSKPGVFLAQTKLSPPPVPPKLLQISQWPESSKPQPVQPTVPRPTVPQPARPVVRQTASQTPVPKIASVRNIPSVARHSSYSFDRYKRYKTLVLNAYQNRKIFTIYGHYPELRSALLARGWLEKLPNGSHRSLQKMSQHSLIVNAKNHNEYETVVLSKMLESYPPYFIWQPKNHYDYHNYAMPFRNRIRLRVDFDFTTKEGLVSCVNRAHERGTLGAEHLIHPRTYRLAFNNEVAEFTQNYRLTHCFNLLLFVSEKSTIEDVFSAVGEVDICCLNFAMSRIENELAVKKGKPSDTSEYMSISPVEWERFLSDSDKVINKGMKFIWTNTEQNTHLEKSKKMIAEVKECWPTFKMDGYSNVWITKPSNYCRGCGIMLATDYNKILNHSKRHFKLRYIAQKYIERPLLIYKTKFDIRQYVLVTVGDVITIYMYKDMYVKFSSQEFDLKRLHESVHVTNFAVQSKYKNAERSELLPPHNMWSLEELKNYFKLIKKDNIWDEFIFPRMENTVVSVMMASFDSADLVTNAFELYGIDFMLTEDFEPVLIEVNATPDMTHSTCVTAKICPATLNDLVKVVVDLPKNPHTNIGKFKPVHKAVWSRGANNKPVIHNNTNLLNTPTTTPLVPSAPAKAVSPVKKANTNISTRLPLKGNRTGNYRQQVIAKKQNTTKRKVVSVPMTKDASNRSKTKPKSTHKLSVVIAKPITKSTNAFLQHFSNQVRSVQSVKKNTSRKEAIANQVLHVIEALYKIKNKAFSNTDPKTLLPDKNILLKSSASKKPSHNHKNKHINHEKFVKSLGEALYNKIWN